MASNWPSKTFLRADPYAVLSKDLVNAFEAGEAVIDNVKTRHLVFSAENIEYQLWIDPATDLPRLLSVTYLDAERQVSSQGSDPMKSSSYLACTVLVAVLLGASPAAGWVHAHGGGAWRGPAGGTHVWHHGVTAGPNWNHGGHSPHWGGCCYDPGAAAVGAAVGVAAGVAIGATIASLPTGCTPMPNGYYICGSVYYRTYYGPHGVIYQVVPAP